MADTEFESYPQEYKDQMLQRWWAISPYLKNKSDMLAKTLAWIAYAFHHKEEYWWSREAIWYLHQNDPEVTVFAMMDQYGIDWKNTVIPDMRPVFEVIAHPRLIVGGIHGS